MPLFLCQKADVAQARFTQSTKKNLRRLTKILIVLRLKRFEPALVKERPLNGKSGKAERGARVIASASDCGRAHSLN